MRRLMEEMAVDVPEGTSGSVKVERFEIGKHDLFNTMAAFKGGRSARSGTYTRLIRNGSLWMSDTTAERFDHLEAAHRIADQGGRVLIGGLGLGMILRVALLTPTVTHVDVVEIDPDVIALIGPHYEKMAADKGIDLVFHEADLFTIKWPVGTRWDVAWFDVWGDVSTDQLEEMTRLRRSYGRRCGWCDCWAREGLVVRRRRERNAWWNI